MNLVTPYRWINPSFDSCSGEERSAITDESAGVDSMAIPGLSGTKEEVASDTTGCCAIAIELIRADDERVVVSTRIEGSTFA